VRLSRLTVRAALMGLAAFAADAPVMATESMTFTYDALGRVVETKITSGVAANNDTWVQYDPAGNRLCYSTGIGTTAAGCTAPPAVTVTQATITFTSGSTTGFSDLLSDGRTVGCATSGPYYGTTGTVFYAPNIPYRCPF
jgi:hypothetical protein